MPTITSTAQAIPEVQSAREEGQAVNTTGASPVWKGYQKIAFRIAFIFFVAISIPNNAEWYQHFFSIDWTRLHYRDLYDIARFGSGINFFGSTLFGSPLYGYANWIITLLMAIAGNVIKITIVQACPVDAENMLVPFRIIRNGDSHEENKCNTEGDLLIPFPYRRCACCVNSLAFFPGALHFGNGLCGGGDGRHNNIFLMVAL